MGDNTIISLLSDTLQYKGVKVNNPHHIEIPSGVTVVIGPNGSGKSLLGKILAKGWNICTNRIRGYKERLNIKDIEFSDIHSLTGFSVTYYQQRYESMMNDDVPSVADVLGDKLNSAEWQQMCERLHLHDIENKKLNYLSSGELRKLLIINLFSALPDILVLDNPYIGLDVASRDLLNDTVCSLANQGVSVIMLLCNPSDIPLFTDTVIPMQAMTIGNPIVINGNMESVKKNISNLFDFDIDMDMVPIRFNVPQLDCNVMFSLNNCDVKYGKNVIIEKVNWMVRRNECWSLSGSNGSGKTTLLSLICADNPQGYRNDITIFDRRRGSGESIWDIKKHIGYISPEMHLYFSGMGDVVSIIAQGLNDTVGNYVKIKPEQETLAMEWLKILRMEHLSQHSFNTLSSGEQRLVLLARTLIKQPQLLILDEPLHGLDAGRKNIMRNLINYLVKRDNTTMIYVTHYPNEVPDCITHKKTL